MLYNNHQGHKYRDYKSISILKYGFNISSVNGPAEFVKDRLYPIPPEIENCTLSLYDSKTEDIPLNPQPCDERNATEKDIFPQCRCTVEQEKSLNDEILAQVSFS